MASSSHYTFDRRLKRALKAHHRTERGAILSMNHDGLIIARPRRQGLDFPLFGLFLILLSGLLVKAATYISLGETAYLEKVADLSAGGALGQAGAWVMQPDWATLALADLIRPYSAFLL